MASDSVEARLRDIEDILGGDIDCEGSVLDDVAWLVGLVRRYRAALVAIRGDGGAPVTHIAAPDIRATYDEGMWVCARCMARYVPGQGGDTDHEEDCPWRIAREALNEEG